MDDLLEDGTQTAQLLGQETFAQLTSLRKTLDKKDTSPNIPKSISPVSITPWTGSTIPKTLPPLPEVLDPTLKAAAFIHHGTTAGNATDLSYEKLEWVGDAYVYVVSTLLISQTFPGLLPGKCSQLRERIVKNVQLAEYARQYGFEKRAKLPPMDSLKQSDKTKIQGDIFEAYIGAVILSDPVNGVSRCSEWLKSLWGMTLAKDIRAQEQAGKVDSPMWRLRGTEEPIQLVATKSEMVIPSRDRLKSLIGVKGINLSYKDVGPERKDKNNKLPIFTVGVYLDGWGEKDKQLGFGSAHGKKEAAAKAADMALSNTKLMNVYVEKKRLFNAQKALEEAALEAMT